MGTLFFNILQTLVLLDHVYSDCLQNVATNTKNKPFSGFGPWPNNYDFRNAYFRLLMTKRKFFVQTTKYQYLKLIRENNQSDLDSRCTVPISQFMHHIKYNVINEYDPVCNIANCYICMYT